MSEELLCQREAIGRLPVLPVGSSRATAARTATPTELRLTAGTGHRSLARDGSRARALSRPLPRFSGKWTSVPVSGRVCGPGL